VKKTKIHLDINHRRPADRIKNCARETASGSLSMIITLNYEQEKAWLRTRRPDEAVEETVSKAWSKKALPNISSPSEQFFGMRRIIAERCDRINNNIWGGRDGIH